MSVQVPLETLAAAAAEYGPTAYAVVSAPDAAPRITHVTPRFDGADVTVVLGGRTAELARTQGVVGLLWPATAQQSMSLIVDATVESVGDDGAVRVRPVGAVRHRPAPSV